MAKHGQERAQKNWTNNISRQSDSSLLHVLLTSLVDDYQRIHDSRKPLFLSFRNSPPQQ